MIATATARRGAGRWRRLVYVGSALRSPIGRFCAGAAIPPPGLARRR